tara:strand:- start:756 stop:1367 length:612 start_codon:yes stop_codon:yes gene_type:complete
MSNDVSKIASAFLKAQKQLKGVVRQNTGLFNAKYADLGQVLDVCQSPLNEEDIIITQGHDYDVANKVFFTTTTLIHTSGETLTNTIGFPIVKGDPHSIASLSTYGRRYSLMAMLGIAQKDDDGTDAMGGYVTDDQKNKYQQLLKHPRFSNKKSDANKKWKTKKTFHEAQIALDAMKNACDNYDAEQKELEIDKEMKTKMEMDV